MRNSPPGVCGSAFSAKDREAYEEWDVVQRVLHNRQTSPRPDDQFGAQKSITDRMAAQAMYAGHKFGYM